MNKKRWLALGTVFTILAALLISCTATNSSAAPETETAVATIGDLSASATASGQVLPQREAVLTASSPARVTTVAVRLGDAVQPGDLLVQLDSTDLQFTVDNAAQTVVLAQARLDNLLAPATDAEIASAQAALASALDGFARSVEALAPVTDTVVLGDATAAMLQLAADIGTMSDRIVEMNDKIIVMADNIGAMSARIVETQDIQQANIALTQASLQSAQAVTVSVIQTWGL